MLQEGKLRQATANQACASCRPFFEERQEMSRSDINNADQSTNQATNHPSSFA
jgi:hypothetical protein